jgi:hypothetical protein
MRDPEIVGLVIWRGKEGLAWRLENRENLEPYLKTSPMDWLIVM